MNFKFVIALLLLGTCLTQTINAQPHHNNIQKGIIDDLAEQVQQAIEKLKAVLETQINEAIAKLKDLTNKITELAQDAINAVQEQLEKVVADAKQMIDDIKQKAEELGTDISECLQENESKFNDLLTHFIENEKQCVLNEVNEALRIVQEAVDIVVEAEQLIISLPEKAKECLGQGLNTIKCLSNLVIEIAKLEKDLPTKIATKVKEVTDLVSGLKVRLEVCAATQVAAAGLEAAQIVTEVAICAAEKQY